MKRFYVLFKGRVQGVGFRWTLVTIAHKYSITGYCKNKENGDVEAQIQGNKDNLDAFMKEILMAKTYIRIDDYAIKEIDIKEDERSFEVKF